jgi:phenylpropionate dioxygenase-like ring-hydroxylating dioxygenase large terminal subunit
MAVETPDTFVDLAVPFLTAGAAGAGDRVDEMSSLSSAQSIDYKTLVQDDRIHASLYTDPRIFDDELERIFRRGWVFVGHDSEIPGAGDFVTRRIGTEPVIMVRGADGAVAVLVNRCMHRGTMVCAADRGHARTFTCPYHGWTYDVSGALLVPYPGGYAALDKARTGSRALRACRATAVSSSPA